MNTVLIAAGDWTKGDQGAPHRVIELLGRKPNVLVSEVLGITPSLAEQIAPADEVIFIDAANELGEPWLEPAGNPSRFVDLVNMARSLFRFQGKAYVCHVPGLDFSDGAPLTHYAESRARQAAQLLQRFLAV